MRHFRMIQMSRLAVFKMFTASSFPISPKRKTRVWPHASHCFSEVSKELLLKRQITEPLRAVQHRLPFRRKQPASLWFFSGKKKRKKEKMAGKALTSILLGMPAALFSLECKQRQLSHSHITCHPHIRWRKHFYQGARQAPPASWSSWTSTAADQKHLSTWHKNWAHSATTLACWHAEDEIAEAANTLLPSWKH